MPCYIDEIAKDIHGERGHTIGNAIQIAVGTVRNWCHGEKNVKADTRAKACTAAAEWEARKAQAHASHHLGEDIDVVVRLTEFGGVTLEDGDGKPLPLIPDKWAWSAMGVQPMGHTPREQHISKYSDRHEKLTGKHQKTPVPNSMHRLSELCVPCNRQEEKDVIHKLETATPDEKKGLMARLGELLGLSESHGETDKDEAVEEVTGLSEESDSQEKQEAGEKASAVAQAPVAQAEGPKSILFQLPYDDSELVALADDPEQGEKGKRLYKKVLAHADRVIYHHLGEGGKLDHSKATLRKMVENFKAKAFDQVPLLTRHSTPNNKDTDVFAYLGELADLELQGDELVGTFRLTEKGEQVLKDNPKLPTSIGYDPAYHRKNDNKRFGPALQHVATVFRPHLNGLGGWEPVHLSDETEVVDLTAAQYSDQHGKERDSVSDVVETPESNKEEVTTELEDSTRASQENVVSLEDFNTLKVQLAEERKARKTQAIKEMLQSEYREVPKAKRDAALTLLSDLSEVEGVIVLGEDGSASVSEGDAKAKAITELLAGCKQNAPDVRLGEELGTGQDTEAANSVDAFDEQVTAYAKENNISWDEAAIRLTEVIN